MMEKNIDMRVVGIKCDEPNCDFINRDVQVTEYEDWIDAPCPKCGASLLTQADYDAIMKMKKIVDFINRFPMPRIFGKKDRVRGEMNGSGKIKFKKL